jgi:hypothetical protein
MPDSIQPIQRTPLRYLCLAVLLPLAGCGMFSSKPAVPADDGTATRAALAYYAATPRPDAGRDRGDPAQLMQQAIQAGQSRPPDLPRALNLLDAVTRSQNPAAAAHLPLARVLQDQYGERLRLEQQLRDALKRGDQLQEKLDALSAIERSLPPRPVPIRPIQRPGGGQ